jgi:D-alanine-D-alanine ligase
MNDVMNAADFGRVAVLMGGSSAERAVSLRSGQAVLDALRRQGVDAQAFDPGPAIVSDLRRTAISRVFLALHGRGGEDGQIQGALDTAGIPYTGSGVLGSALGMDKQRTKLVWRGVGVSTPAFVMLGDEADLERAAAIGFPLMIKPVHEGSSIGLARVDDVAGLRAAWLAAARYDREVMAEQWIFGEEYTVAILGSEALPLIRLETPRAFYDYEAKYSASNTRYSCPCGLPAEQESAIQQRALEAFAAVGASGWGRVDLLLDRQGTYWFLEVNTAPGMTDHSLVPMAARARGIEFDELVWRILGATLGGG